MFVSCVLAVLLPCSLSATAGAYPLYNAKSRYSRSMAWPAMPLYYPPRATRPFYYPQPQVESDYYYPQEPYYYPVDKYPVYQSVVPSYYLDQQRPYYYGYDEAEPDDNIEEDMTEETERRDSLPYGQETWYQESAVNPDSNADVNARFLQNLILAQMYNDANTKYPGYGIGEYPPLKEEEDTSHWVYGEPVKSTKQKTISKEDEDVRELKSLIRGPERMERTDKKSRKNSEDLFAAQTNSNEWNDFRSSYKRSNDAKFSSRKSKLPSTTTAAAPEATPQSVRGQKEVVLPRPANPARTPDFHKFVSTRSSTREPSVFDTIKKLLHMEEKLDEEKANSRIQKRSYIDSEESLVAQLGGLKKMA